MSQKNVYPLVTLVLLSLILISLYLWFSSSDSKLAVSFPTPAPTVTPATTEDAYLQIITHLNQLSELTGLGYDIAIHPDPTCSTCFQALVTFSDGSQKTYLIQEATVTPLINNATNSGDPR